MASLRRVLGSRIALGAALLASACQHDSNADFDDTNLHSGDGGSATTTSGTSSGAEAGQGTEAGSSSGGSSAEAGSKSGGSGGKPATTAGAGGSASGGKGSAGSSSGSDSGGKASAGTGNEGGNQGGTAGTTGEGGKGGGPVEPPKPVTFTTRDIDDTHVASCFPQMNFGEGVSVNVDGDQACRYEILFNAPLKEVPDGALVSAASLVLDCINTGDPVTVSYVDEAWNELSVRWSSRPEVGTTLGTFTCAQLGPVTIDLTAAVKAWLAGTHANYGIYLRSETTGGSDYSTSEAKAEASRPLFSVTYTLPLK